MKKKKLEISVRYKGSDQPVISSDQGKTALSDGLSGENEFAV
jgi:hypothetical protein